MYTAALQDMEAEELDAQLLEPSAPVAAPARAQPARAQPSAAQLNQPVRPAGRDIELVAEALPPAHPWLCVPCSAVQ